MENCGTHLEHVCSKMATQGGAGSIAGTLFNVLNPHAYSDNINYINKDDGVTCRDFENSTLSEYYTLDLSNKQ